MQVILNFFCQQPVGTSQSRRRFCKRLNFKDGTSSNPARELFRCLGSFKFYWDLYSEVFFWKPVLLSSALWKAPTIAFARRECAPSCPLIWKQGKYIIWSTRFNLKACLDYVRRGHWCVSVTWPINGMEGKLSDCSICLSYFLSFLTKFFGFLCLYW